MTLPKSWYLEHNLDRNAIYMISIDKSGKNSSEKLNDSQEHERVAEKPTSTDLGAILEARVHDEGKLKVSHLHSYNVIPLS